MVMELISKTFSQINREEKLVIVDYSADWCAPCKVLEPVFKQLSQEITKAKFYKVDVEKESDLTKKFDIMSVPTIIIFKKGKEIVRINGFPGKEKLKDVI